MAPAWAHVPGDEDGDHEAGEEHALLPMGHASAGSSGRGVGRDGAPSKQPAAKWGGDETLTGGKAARGGDLELLTVSPSAAPGGGGGGRGPSGGPGGNAEGGRAGGASPGGSRSRGGPSMGGSMGRPLGEPMADAATQRLVFIVAALAAATETTTYSLPAAFLPAHLRGLPNAPGPSVTGALFASYG